MSNTGKKGVFLLLDVALVLCLFSMVFCMRPMRFDFVSEWMRQCQAGAQTKALPILLATILIGIVLLQLDWMYRVSLHHLHKVAKLHALSLAAQADAAADATRTRMACSMLSFKAHPEIVCVDGHSTAAFVASFAAIVGIATVVRFDWKSPESWLHFYGVFLFCSGFFVILQIVWFNLQRVSAVASLRHLPPPRGMHWLVDSAIILFLLVFLMFNFILGQTGGVVVGSELFGFALMMLQFLYVFQACCCSCEPLVVQPTAAWRPRLLACVLLLLPYPLFFVLSSQFVKGHARI